MAGYDVERLQETLGTRLHFYPELGSTNDEALRLGREERLREALVLTDRQLAGRGRRGAAWLCPEGAGLTFSLLICPKFNRVLWPRLSLVAGAAVAKVMEKNGLLPQIKWPNDVLIGEKKICGILVETQPEFVIIGVGLNVNKACFPEEIQAIATSLEDESGQKFSREEILLAIIKEFEGLLAIVEHDFSSVIDIVRERCALTGKQISYLLGSSPQEGLCSGISEGGDLLVNHSGSTHRVTTADQVRALSS